jgi:hypothetical protein
MPAHPYRMWRGSRRIGCENLRDPSGFALWGCLNPEDGRGKAINQLGAMPLVARHWESAEDTGGQRGRAMRNAYDDLMRPSPSLSEAVYGPDLDIIVQQARSPIANDGRWEHIQTSAVSWSARGSPFFPLDEYSFPSEPAERMFRVRSWLLRWTG